MDDLEKMNKKTNLRNLGLAGEGRSRLQRGYRDRSAGDWRGRKGGRHKERLGRARLAAVAEERSSVGEASDLSRGRALFVRPQHS